MGAWTGPRLLTEIRGFHYPPSWWKLGESFVNWCGQKWNSTRIQGDYLNGRLCHNRPSTISPYQYLHMASPSTQLLLISRDHTTNSPGPAIAMEPIRTESSSTYVPWYGITLYKCLYQLGRTVSMISTHHVPGYDSVVQLHCTPTCISLGPGWRVIRWLRPKKYPYLNPLLCPSRSSWPVQNKWLCISNWFVQHQQSRRLPRTVSQCLFCELVSPLF